MSASGACSRSGSRAAAARDSGQHERRRDRPRLGDRAGDSLRDHRLGLLPRRAPKRRAGGAGGARGAVPATAFQVVSGLRLNLAAAGAFAVVAVLVVSGALSGLDQYAVDHWMVDVQPSAPSSALGAIQFYPRFGSALHTFFDFWTYPASPVFSTAVLAAACVVLYRRGARSAALAWPFAWVAANSIELLGKSVLERPSLHFGRAPLYSFDNSFPSGHTVRALLVTVVLASLWRRVGIGAVVWALVTLPMLVVNANHTPSDVLGGAVLATALVFAVRAWLARAAPVGLAYAPAASR